MVLNQVNPISVRRNIIANYFGAAWNALMGVLFVPIYIKYLGIEAYGLVGIFTIIQSWLSLLDLGMTPALSREIALCGNSKNAAQQVRDLLRSIELVAFCTASVAALVITLGSSWIASRWLHTEKISIGVASQAFQIMGAVIGLRFVENIYRGSMIGLQRQVLLNIIGSATATLRGLGAVGVLVLVAPSVHLFFLWQGAISILSLSLHVSAVYRFLPPRSRRPKFSPTALKNIWRFAAGSMTIAIMSLLLTQVDKIVLSRVVTLKAFGYYTFAAMVSQLPFLVVGPVTQAIYPRFTKLIGENKRDDLARSYHAAAQLVGVLLSSATMLLLFFGKEVLFLWTRDRELTVHAYSLVAILSVGSLFNGILTIPYYLQLASGWTGLSIKIGLAAAAAVVPALLFVVPTHGGIGAAWILLAMNATTLVAGVQLMHRRLLPGERRHWYIVDNLFPVLAAGTSALVVYLVAPTHLGKIATLLILFVAGLVVSLSSALAAPLLRQTIRAYVSQYFARVRDSFATPGSGSP